MKTFELTEEQRNDLYFKNFDGTIKIDGFVFSDYKGNTTMRISNTQEERPKRRGLVVKKVRYTNIMIWQMRYV